MRGLVVCAVLLAGRTNRVEAQRLTPVAFSEAAFSSPDRAETPPASPHAMPAERASRGTHVVIGAVPGAVVGGLSLVILNQEDHSGEGLTDSTVFAGGALIGALVGAMLGAMFPYGDM